jgi:hypothetical protein
MSYTTRKLLDKEGTEFIIGDFGGSSGGDFGVCGYIALWLALTYNSEQVSPKKLKELIADTLPHFAQPGVFAEREVLKAIAEMFNMKIYVYNEAEGMLNWICNVGSGDHKAHLFWYPGLHYANVFPFTDDEHMKRILDEYKELLASIELIESIQSNEDQIDADHALALRLQEGDL